MLDPVARRRRKRNDLTSKGTALRSEKTIVFAKREILWRQMDTAIWLWFSERDIVSTAALIGNAIEILHAIGKEISQPAFFKTGHKAGGGVNMSELTTNLNALKHSDGNLEGTTRLTPAAVEWMMYDSIMLFGELYGSPTGLMNAFLAWFVIFWSDKVPHFTGHFSEFRANGLIVEKLMKLGRPAFLREVSPVCFKGIAKL